MDNFFNWEIHIIIENGSVSYLTFHYWFQIKSLGYINKHANLHGLDTIQLENQHKL